MTKAVVLTSYYRPKPGGFCKRYFRAINALLSEGAEVHYLALEKFPIDHAQCYFHKFPWPRRHADSLMFWVIFQIFSPFFLLYLGFRYNITRSFAFGPTYSFLLQPLRILKRIPLSLFLRADTILNHQISGRANVIVKIDQLIEGLAIQGVRVYGVSNILTNTVVNRHTFFKPEKYASFKNDIVEKNLIKNYENRIPAVIGCVGILEKRKNLEVVFKAVNKLPDKKIRLNIYGIGPAEDELRQQVVNLGISDKVNFKGWVDSNQIWPEIDLLVMPSLHEGAPNAVLESLSHGVPILASDIAEHAEILPSEYLVSRTSAEEWSRRITEILNNKLLFDEVRHLQRQFAQKLIFDWEKQISELILGD